MSNHSPTPTTVWRLAEVTGQPLATVVFQAVSYGAWNRGGHIGADWSDSLHQVLSGSQPWRRQVALPDPAPLAGSGGAEGPSRPKGGATLQSFAARVLGALGRSVPVADMEWEVVDALASAGLGERGERDFTGYAEETVSWSELASGTLGLEDLASPGSQA